MICPNINFAVDATVTTYTQYIDQNGYMVGFKLTVANFTNSITVTITIKDEASATVYSLGTLAENTTHMVGEGLATDATIGVPIDRDFTATLTLSGAAGGTGGAVVFKPFIMEA